MFVDLSNLKRLFVQGSTGPITKVVMIETNIGIITREPTHLSTAYVVDRRRKVELRQTARLPTNERTKDIYQVIYYIGWL